MARRRYFRYYPRRTVAKKKWASNLKDFVITASSANPSVTVLVENKVQQDAPTPTIIKCGNFKVQGDVVLHSTSSGPVGGRCDAYVLFVPEGITDVTRTLAQQHPEWIMGWTLIDLGITATNAESPGNKFSITSRLKRNLNSGDKVVLLVHPTGISVVEGASMAQYWTCAN